MSRPLITIHNTETDEIVEREMNDTEFSEYQKKAAESDAKKEADAEAEIKRLVALNKLQALGLDENDLKALGL